MTDATTQQLENRLRADLAGITGAWEDMLTPPSPRMGPKTKGSGASLPDDDEATDDTPRMVQVIDARAHVTAILNTWCRVVLDDHAPTHGIPSGYDVPGMCDFLTRWSYLMAEHDAARDMADEVSACRVLVEKLAPPQHEPPAEWEPKPRTLRLGACPLVWQHPETAKDEPCPGRLVGGEDGWVWCESCGTRAVMGWWEEQIDPDAVPSHERTVTAKAVVKMAHEQYGQRITEAAVWQWVRRGKLVPTDAGVKPLTFRLHEVVYLLTKKVA